MAIRKILRYGTPSLRQESKEVHKVSKRINDIVRDLLDTLYARNGVGLAAPQIGENYRIFVVDTSSGNEPLKPLVFINPKMLKKTGAFISNEGCLSFPEVFTDVRRYSDIIIKALDSNGRPFTLEAKDGCLLARAIQHEFDHLDGILFIDHARNRFEVEQELQKQNLPSIEVDKLIEEDFLENQIKTRFVEGKK